MFMVVCPKCRVAIRVTGDAQNIDSTVGNGSDFWPDRYPCFKCGEGATACLEPELDAAVAATLEIFTLLPEEALAALHGLGLPDEHACYRQELEKMFGAHGIKIKGRQHRSQSRFYLDWLELQDGTRVFLAPSPHGACIYRVSPPQRYADRVSNVG